MRAKVEELEELEETGRSGEMPGTMKDRILRLSLFSQLPPLSLILSSGTNFVIVLTISIEQLYKNRNSIMLIFMFVLVVLVVLANEVATNRSAQRW